MLVHVELGKKTDDFRTTEKTWLNYLQINKEIS